MTPGEARSFGLYGSGGQQGIHQLGMDNGQQMKALVGLNQRFPKLLRGAVPTSLL